MEYLSYICLSDEAQRHVERNSRPDWMYIYPAYMAMAFSFPYLQLVKLRLAFGLGVQNNMGKWMAIHSIEQSQLIYST